MWGEEIDNNIERSEYHIDLYMYCYSCRCGKSFYRDQKGVHETAERDRCKAGAL